MFKCQRLFYVIFWDTQWRSCLRHCATSWKVMGSIPDGVIGIFHWHNPSSHTMALGLTQPLTEMSTWNNSLGVKAAGAYDWQPYHLHLPTVLKSGSLNLLKPYGPVQACNWNALPFPYAFFLPGFVDSRSWSLPWPLGLPAFVSCP
jgi:hypothetical protein